MDSFTQRMLELAEERSKTLGISSTNKFPLTEYNQEASVNTMKNQNSGKNSPSPTKKCSVVRKESNTVMSKNTSQRMSSSNDTKENVDVALEINITTGPNVQVQVEVEEREIDEHGNVLNSVENASNERLPMIRDSSRNRLQRLGAMYSETENLSSPIHRNEARFDDEAQVDGNGRGKSSARLGKLAALASQINNWEDESSNSDGKSTMLSTSTSPTKSAPTIVGASPRKIVNTGAIPKQPTKSNLSPTKKINEVASTADGTAKRPSKQLKWDKNVMDHLEQQGFQRRESTTSKLVYDYNGPKDSVAKTAPEPAKPVQSTVETAKKTYVSTAHISQVSEVKSPRPVENKPTGKHTAVVTKGLVSDRAARFESSQPTGAQRKDPAEMSLKERLALFEKNKGAALIPKAALGMSVSAKQIMGEGQTPKSITPEKPKVNSFNKPVFAETTASGSGIRNAVAALMSNATTLSQSQISNDIRKQREKEMNVVLSRFNRPIESTSSSEPDSTSRSVAPPPAPPMPKHLLSKDRSAEGKSNAKRKSNEKLPQQPNERHEPDEDSKRVKVNPTQNTRLYPVLSDIESHVTESDRDDCTTATMSDEQNYQHSRSYSEEDSYMDSAEEDDICNMSLGREIMQAVKRNDPLRPQTRNSFNNSHNRDSSTASEYSGNGQNDDIDDYINEALEDDGDSYQENVTPQRQGSISSNSFSYARSPAKGVRHQTIDEDDCEDDARQINFRCPVKSELTVNPSEDNNVVRLTHTVSFYRRQQSQSVNNTPVRRLEYSDEEEDSASQASADTSNDNSLFDVKLKQLLESIHRQERVIYETSKALNVCAQSVEFSGSTVSVESERHLLLATKRRKALLDEVNRLKVDRCIRPPGLPTDRGILVAKEIIIPLKEDYISKLDMDVCNGHHLVCLLTYNDQVLATNAVTTRKGLKAVKFPDELRLSNVYADFTLFLEIYGMTAQREVVHDIKKTPKGKKQRRQPLPSPGGPSAVRTSAFTHYGSVTFSIKEVNRNSWSLNQESFVSPLLGKIFMKVHCELSVSIHHKGFLTMFEDVSGFGAWHRRWCCLHGNILSYWRYPDDEKSKPPMGSIDLQNCHSQKIEPVRRDVCARLHTVLIELKRPCQKDDKNSLVLEKHSNYTIVRHLLSADTKEDRDIWIAHFNKALVIIRSWNASKKA